MADENELSRNPLHDSQNGLTESTFEWVGRPSTRQSDDESESIVSYDVSTADEDVSVIGTDLSDGDAQETVSQSSELLAREFISPSHPLQPSETESHLQASNVSSEFDSSSLERSLSYTECGNSQSGYVEAHGSLELPNGDELYLKYGLAREYHITSDRQPFRILLVGKWDREENPVVEKVAHALAAGEAQARSPSQPSQGVKLSVVPLTNFWQTASAPEVALIESTGLEIIVDRLGVQDFVNNRTDSATGEQRLRDFRVPDLAILLHSSSKGVSIDDVFEKEMFDYVRHRTDAVIELAADGDAASLQTTAQTIPGSLSSIFRTKAMGTGRTGQQPQLVEVSAFTKIQPLQLNRHIAHLINLPRMHRRNSARKGDTRVDRIKTRSDELKDWMIAALTSSVKKVRQLLVNHDAAVYKTVIAVLSTTLLAFTIQAMLPFSHDFSANSHSSGSGLPIVQVTQVTEHIASLMPASAMLLASSSLTPASVSVQTALAKSSHILSPGPSKSSSMPSRRQEEFEIMLASDGIILVQAPRSKQKQRDFKNVIITVTRSGTPLEASIDDVGMGRYKINIPARNLNGILRVLIQAENSPDVVRELNLGNADSRIAPDMVKEIAIRLSQESMRLSKIASQALAESSMTLNTLMARSAEWQHKSLERLRTSQAHLETISTALGQHFTSQQEWIQDVIQTSQDGITKSLSAIHHKASTDVQKYRKHTSRRLRKMHKKAARSLAKAQKRALRELDRASKDLAVQSSKFNMLGQRAKKVRQFVLKEAARKGAHHGRIIEGVSRNAFRKARTRAHKLWAKAPRDHGDGALKQSQRTRGSR